MSLTSRLRGAVQPAHDRIEQLPVALAMAEGRVGREEYCLLLAELARLHEALEGALASRPELGGVYLRSMARAGDAWADLSALGADPTRWEPSPEGRDLAGRFRDWAESSPPALLGALYVFEGSRLGSMVLARPIARALNVPPEAGAGLDYHVRDLATRMPQWQAFKARFDAAPLSAAEQDEVTRGALETFAGLLALYEAVPARAADTLQPVGASA